MKQLKVVLLCGPTASGKSFATERILSVDYNVLTGKLDSMYRAALGSAGVPRGPDGSYSVFKAAHAMRDESEYDEHTVRQFFSMLESQIRGEVEQAHQLGLDLVLEGYTARFTDEARMIFQVGQSVSGGPAISVSRIQMKPPLDAWNHHRNEVGASKNRTWEPAEAAYYERQMGAPDPVRGIQDYVISDLDELKTLLDDHIKLRPHKWYQRFSLGPITTKGPSDAHEKVNVILDQDITGKRVLDLCCATGVHAILVKDRGAKQVVGIELDPTRYAKGVELRKTLLRHSDVDARVSLRRGNITDELPKLKPFDTISFLGALHYFPDYDATLRSVARVADEAVYLEFCFAEGEHDTAEAPGEIRAYTRSRTGTTIYMGDRDTIVRTLGAAMPDFDIEEKTPISPPGAKLVSQREVWRLRRREPR